MNKFNQGFDEILYWLKKKGPEYIWESLFHPRAEIFHETDRALETVPAILNLLPTGVQRIFSIFCLACLALNDEVEVRHVAEELSKDLIYQNMEPAFEQIVSAKWIKIPLLLADSQSGFLRWALLSLGTGKRFPNWTENNISVQSIEAVTTAAKLARVENDYYFWPIIDFNVESILINGRSLSLPVFLGLKSLQFDKSQVIIAASGCVEKTGLLKPVNYLEHKAKVCREHGFMVLICPEQPLPDISGPEYIPVNNILQAWAAWNNYSPDCGFGACLSLCGSLETMTKILPSLPVPVLQHLRQTMQMKSILKSIVKDPEDLARFINNIKFEIQKPEWDKEKVVCLLDEICPELLSQVENIDPLLQNDLAALQIFKCNYLGRLNEVSQWSRISHDVNKILILSDWGEARIIESFNLSIVHNHNRYRFNPAVDPSTSPVAEMVSFATSLFEKREEQVGYALNPVLGALFGTLTQNYGFCGPNYIEKTIQCSELAMRFFGRGRVNGKSREDYLRQHSYLFYAFLDAEEIQKALDHLLFYLDIKKLEDFNPADPNPYKHACLMRFLSQRHFLAQNYITWAETAISEVPHQHPWQLWFKNLAKATDDMDIRYLCIKKSVDICLTNSGHQATMVPMALQGLCLLAEYRFESLDKIINKVNEINEFIKRSSLDDSHFSPLTSMSFSIDELPKVAILIKDLFPFSYR